MKNQSGSAVAGAYVYAVSDHVEHAVTEKDGTFYINVGIGDYINVTMADQSLHQFLVNGDDQVYVLSPAGKTVSTGFTLDNTVTNTMATSTITSEEISKYNTSDIFQSLYATLPGLTVLSREGFNAKPGLTVRGGATFGNNSPLVIIDGFQRSLSEITSTEVESISVLKDATATALYGTQGANGVIVVTTKRGDYKALHADINYNFGLGLPFDMPSFVNAADYATATNEARMNDGLDPIYTPQEIEAYRTGIDPFLYPNVNWLEKGMRDFTNSHHFNVSFSGGGNNVRYFADLNYENRTGLLAGTHTNDKFSTQQRNNNLSARVNLDIDITKSTQVRLNLFGQMSEDHRPTGDDVIPKLYKVPANAFPIKNEDGTWGGNAAFGFNPVADIQDVGYYNMFKRQLWADMRLTQDFSMWVKGLKAELAVAWDNMASYQEGNKKTYSRVLNNAAIDPVTGRPVVTSSARFGEDKSLSYWHGLNSQFMNAAFEAKVAYDRHFGKHFVDANLLYRQESSVNAGKNQTFKYQNLMLYGGYNYDNRYIVDIVANYYGSSLLFEGDRFTFYPAASAAWVISNEGFLKDSKAVQLLKLRASAGRSGFTGFGYDLNKSYYVWGGSYFFGEANLNQGGVHEGNLPMTKLKNQVADKFNVGIDMNLFSKWDLTADFYTEKRSRILVSSDGIYSSVLGVKPQDEYVGVMTVKGVDLGTTFHDQVGGFKYSIGGTFSFQRNRIVENNEGPLAEPYLSKIGTSRGQSFGLEALGFFQDQADIDNSPRQTFGTVRPGDIKYKDQNNDGIIDNNDRVSMGYSTALPEIYYGVNINLEWKGLGVNLNFQGTGYYNKMLNVDGLHRPLTNNANLSEWYWKENVRWTPETAANANLPRLSYNNNPNNDQASSFWLADASYFSLRNAHLYYNLPQKWCKKMRMSQFQIYVKGQNIFRVDDLKYVNPDAVGSLYPQMRMFYFGLNLKF